MKINLLNFLAFSIFSITFAQVEKNVGTFTKITSFDQIDVLLVQSSENKIVINGNLATEVQTINKNGELKIRMPLDKTMQGDAISVTVYADNLTALEANEGSRITTSDTFSAHHFTIIVKEGAKIKVNLEVKKLSVKASSGGILNVAGIADNQTVTMNSGAVYHAQNFETNDTEISLNAGGEAEVFAKTYIKATVRAGGDILIYGNPKQIDKKIVITGTILEQ
jgi:hypothetical protein